MDSLPLFLVLAGRPVIILAIGPDAAEAAAAKARLVEAAGGIVVGEDAANPVLAFIAADDPVAAAAAAARLRSRGLLVNVVDRPAMSDFLMGAIIDRSPVQLAISTGGASASLSRALRGRLEALLPASLGGLARAIGKARKAASAAHPGIADRRRLWERALADGAALDPLRPLADPEAAVAAAISGVSTAVTKVQTILITSADPDDLTLNQLSALGRCDALLVEADVPAAIIDRARRDAMRLAALADAPAGLTLVLRWSPPAASQPSQASNSVSQ
jgi:uroporphyrin-III C-methyltransferase/precorrin-2 dehydrogenase/sirohydrochlorin ferrochelatase